ncbi:probable acyl-activating enzyme 1, peroxisomal [Tanacetum coccineum]
MVSTLLKRSGAKLIFVDYRFLDVTKGALDIISKSIPTVPQLVLIPDSEKVATRPKSEIMEYDALLAMGTLDFEIRRPKDEFHPIALNYTSGTTSSPKGVVYSHCGAYLNSLSAVLRDEMPSMSVYLWTVPMFHCNGWCLTWAVAAQGVTHMSGAPTVLNMIINAPASEKLPLPGKVSVMTGGAPPPSQVVFICTWKPEWNSLPPDMRAEIKSRQGVNHLGLEEVDIKDPVTMKSVLLDAKTFGEVMVCGNTVMNGYLKDTKATQEAFQGGWFRSGDLGVRHSDGYIELKDRSKDIIISGGENISTIEVVSVIFRHPAVLEAAVVGRPDDH